MIYRAPHDNSLDVVVSNFLSLESELMNCLVFIPCTEENQNVFSPRFIPIMLESCSLVESILRRMLAGKARQTLRSLAVLLEDRLELEHATTMMLTSPLQLLRPFQGWKVQAPVWWSAYNKLKHDRIANYSAASLSNTLEAFAALHQVVARSWLFIESLAKAGCFNENSEAFGELIPSRCAGSGPPDLQIETKLCVSAIRNDFVDWSADPPKIEDWEFTMRVKQYIWDYEGW